MIKPPLPQLNFAKFGPPLNSLGCLVLSVGAYALWFGLGYAVGFVLLLLMHEMGHCVAARRLGMSLGLPTWHTL
jgi:Zn-dependent protease